MPYDYSDMMTAMSGIADGRPRRRQLLEPLPDDLTNLRRARRRLRAGLMPMPPYTNVPQPDPGMYGPGQLGIDDVGFRSDPRLRRRAPRLGLVPMGGILQPQGPAPTPNLPTLATPSPSQPLAVPNLSANIGGMPGATTTSPNTSKLSWEPNLPGSGFGFGG